MKEGGYGVSIVEGAPSIGFPEAVFEVFSIPGFEMRMPRLREVVTPRLRDLGEVLTPRVSELAGEPLYPHVALHMRRRVNPPDDTWVAFGPAARGYKALPHFEVGVDQQSVFVRFVIKPEGQKEKAPFFRAVSLARLKEMAGAEPVFWYAGDHGEGPVAVAELKPRLWSDMKARALKKDGSITVGLVIPHDDPAIGGPALMGALEERLRTLVPLYRAARRL